MPISTARILYLGFLSAFSLLTFDLYQAALPTITVYFNTSHAMGQLTLSFFFFVFGLSQLFWGPLIDYYGRMRMLKWSMILFSFATLLCIYAPDIITLIFARGLQGFCVCCANIVAFSTTRDTDDTLLRAQLLSYISMMVSISPIFAPLIGSLIFISFGWRATFASMLFLNLLLYGLSRVYLSESPYWKPSVQPLTLSGIFQSYQGIIKSKTLWLSIMLITMSYSCIMIEVINAAYFLMDNMKLSPVNFAACFASIGVVIIISNFCGIRLREKKGLLWNLRLGVSLMLGFASISLLVFYFKGLSLFSLLPLLLVNFGVGLSNPPTMSLALSSYTHQAATASSVINTMRMCLSAIIASSVGILVVHHPYMIAVGILFCSLVSFIICWFSNTIRSAINRAES